MKRFASILITLFVSTGLFAQTVTNVAERQSDYNGHEYVDLGLSVKWATCNVGASKPEDYGGYFQWAGTTDVSSTSIYLDWSNCPYHSESNYRTHWTKYNTQPSYGTVDHKTVLEPSDDAAHVNWGGNWRMPTGAEWTELRENCSWIWITLNGVNGYLITSDMSGYKDKSIFLPAAGCRYGDGLGNVGVDGCYWLSTLYADYPNRAYDANINFTEIKGDNCYSQWYFIIRSSNDRYYGQSVRPVSD